MSGGAKLAPPLPGRVKEGAPNILTLFYFFIYCIHSKNNPTMIFKGHIPKKIGKWENLNYAFWGTIWGFKLCFRNRREQFSCLPPPPPSLCSPEKYHDSMVAGIITNHSVPAALDITNLLRVEEVTAQHVVTLGGRPAKLAWACGVPVVGVRVVDCWQWRSGHYNHQSFLLLFSRFFPSVETFSHRRSARIKKLI